MEDGLYAVSAETLTDFSFPYLDNPNQPLRLTRDGNPVPYHVNGDIIYFYGQAITNTLSAPAVYVLQPTSNSAESTAMENRSAMPLSPGSPVAQHTFRFEENDLFLASVTEGDVWLGELIFAPSQQEIELEARGILPDETAMLRVRVWSNNQSEVNPDHHLIAKIGDTVLADEFWDDITSHTFTAKVDATLFENDKAVLTLEAPGDTGSAGEAIYVDWVELDYVSGSDGMNLGRDPLDFISTAETVAIENASNNVLLFDISDPNTPVHITDTQLNGNTLSFNNDQVGEIGSRYIAIRPNQALAPPLSTIFPWDTNLRTDIEGADYLALYPFETDYAEALDPLLALREERGLTTLGIPIQQVYDQFGNSRASDTAIRDFITYAVQNWQNPPTYVLLVGDASYDINQFTEGSNQDIIPTHMVYTEFAGYVASDTWLATTSETDLTPLVALGRFPVQTADQLRILVDKTIAYETEPDGDWQSRTLLVSDDDQAGFPVASDQLGESLSASGFQNQKLYIDESTQNSAMQTDIINALNEGVGIINYVGHGSVRVWGDERVFQVDDAEKLTNDGQYPIFTTFTCLNGYFNHPSDASLSEALLWQEGGGIVAAVAPSGRSLTAQQTPLADKFFDSLLEGGEAETIGEALQLAKASGATNEYLQDVVHTFNLLGDPALRFRKP